MKLNLRFRHLLPFLALLGLDPIFSRFAVEDIDDPVLHSYLYIMLCLSPLLIWAGRQWFSLAMRRWLLLVLISIAALMIESYQGWGKWIAYPHVLMKLANMLLLFGIYAYYRKHGLPTGLGFVLGCLPLVVVLNMALYTPSALTLGGFLHADRGINVTTAFLITLAALYFLNRYLSGASISNLLYFFALLGFIVFLQHRTVWLSTGLALLVNTFLLTRLTSPRLSIRRIAPIFLLPLFGIILGGLTMVLNNPAVLDQFAQNIEDIRNPNKQGTGEWRRLQREAYTPLIEERPLMGWRMEGFEVPIQFYDPSSDQPMWRDYTGHHFHSFYVDRMFYFGFLGLLMVIGPLLFILYRGLQQKRNMSPLTLALVSFGISSLLYGISYDWPTYLYGIIGLLLAAVEIAVSKTQQLPQSSDLPLPQLPVYTSNSSANVYA